MTRLLFFLGLLLLAGLPAHAGAPGALVKGVAARVASVTAGDAVVLDDGRRVRLVGIQAPKLSLGRAGFADWPLAHEAKAKLEKLVAGQTVTLRLAPQAMDRHGRVLAHLVRTADGLWVQGALLSAGLARVYTFPDNRVLAGAMLGQSGRAPA